MKTSLVYKAGSRTATVVTQRTHVSKKKKGRKKKYRLVVSNL